MADRYQVATPFLFEKAAGDLGRRWRNTALRVLEKISGLERCQQLYDEIENDCKLEDFLRQALAKASIDYQLSDSSLARVPQSGACVLVANHPYGAAEGLVLFHLLSRVRPDFKVLGNFLLGRVPQLREKLIEVDPFGGKGAARANVNPLRQALQHLQAGGLLVIFPAGEVSSWQGPGRGVVDPPWSDTVARLVLKSKAAVLPVFFPGHNGPLFQLAGTLHPRLRTLLLPKMLLKGRKTPLTPLIGNLIPSKKWASFANDRQLVDYLRLRTYALGLDPVATAAPPVGKQAASQPVALSAAVAVSELCMELAALPAPQRLLQSGEFDVFFAAAGQIPRLLHEIGRLRELTFRAAGEGTGQAFDLDDFDQDYLHLFVWNREQEELVGAYRVGRVDQLLASRGKEGLYTTTLFDFKPELLEHLEQGLELGRSFVRPEYQRSFAPLLLLWKGIGHYLTLHPQYRFLFGPVSISQDYSDRSRELMTCALSRHYLVKELANLVAPRLPVPIKPLKVAGLSRAHCDDLLSNIDDVAALVADLEEDSKGIPVLLRHYLGLGGKLLAFNLDPAFSDVIDGLLLVDLPQADRKQLQRYMGRDGYESYLEQQRRLQQTAAPVAVAA